MKGLLLLLLGLLAPIAATADNFVDASVERLQAYMRIDTINPPGNEVRGVAYLAGIFDEAGIAYETAESAPGRGNIWARLKGWWRMIRWVSR